jgi:hypothetical protein
MFLSALGPVTDAFRCHEAAPAFVTFTHWNTPTQVLCCALPQALGPVTDAGVAVKQHLGLFPNIRITANKAKDSGSSSSSATATASAMHSGSVNVAKAVSFMPHISVTSGAPVAAPHGTHNMHFKIGGRKLAQACDPQAKVSCIIVCGVKGVGCRCK